MISDWSTVFIARIVGYIRVDEIRLDIRTN